MSRATAACKGLDHTPEAPVRYWIYRDPLHQWRWYLEAANGRKIANGGEGYYNEPDCLSAIALVKGSATAPIYKKAA
jgi:uncharacterized protein YegP (UPF0339 family)